MWRSQWNAVGTGLGLVFPPQCLPCGVHLEGARNLCDRCRRALDLLRARPACPRCAASPGPYLSRHGRCGSCRARRLAFDGSVRVAPYDGVMRGVLRRFKYHGAEHVDGLLADLMQRAVVQMPWRPRLEVLMAVPPHWSRVILGGGYPAATLGRLLARRLRLPCPPLLRRRRFDHHQVGLSLADRIRNVEDAFVVCNGVNLAGAVVGVVDDVMTSGATLNEVARVLKRAGAAAVFNIVLARAGRRDVVWGAA